MRGRPLHSCVGVALALLVLVASGSFQARAATAPELQNAVLARLDPMRAVAHAKFAQAQPIEDLAREAEVLTRMQARGEALGLTGPSTRALGVALIAASKAIQQHWFDTWKNGAPPAGPVPDLGRTLRPQIDAATDAMLIALAMAPTTSRTAVDAQGLAAWRRLGVGEAETRNLVAALASVAAAPVSTSDSALDRIPRRGWLRVGVPGDYAPFAFPARPPATGSEGIDIDIARALANTLGVELLLVPTSWASLLSDLNSGRFDIALGGVTRTLARQRAGMFSMPYFEDGKSAIVRCADVERFTKLAEIDVPDVHVLVNRGGGNEVFVNATIRHARVTVRDDNLGLFPAIARGDGDVIFTDSAEIRWQTQRDARLCQALGGARLNALDKAVLLPRDPILRDYLDLFLGQLRSSGELSRIISRYLP